MLRLCPKLPLSALASSINQRDCRQHRQTHKCSRQPDVLVLFCFAFCLLIFLPLGSIPEFNSQNLSGGLMSFGSGAVISLTTCLPRHNRSGARQMHQSTPLCRQAWAHHSEMHIGICHRAPSQSEYQKRVRCIASSIRIIASDGSRSARNSGCKGWCWLYAFPISHSCRKPGPGPAISRICVQKKIPRNLPARSNRCQKWRTKVAYACVAVRLVTDQKIMRKLRGHSADR